MARVMQDICCWHRPIDGCGGGFRAYTPDPEAFRHPARCMPFALVLPSADAATLLVSSGESDSVLRYDATTGAFIDTFAYAAVSMSPKAWLSAWMETST